MSLTYDVYLYYIDTPPLLLKACLAHYATARRIVLCCNNDAPTDYTGEVITLTDQVVWSSSVWATDFVIIANTDEVVHFPDCDLITGLTRLRTEGVASAIGQGYDLKYTGEELQYVVGSPVTHLFHGQRNDEYSKLVIINPNFIRSTSPLTPEHKQASHSLAPLLLKYTQVESTAGLTDCQQYIYGMQKTMDFSVALRDSLAMLYGGRCNTATRVLEIGSFYGLGTLDLYRQFCLHPDSHITCVDPWDGQTENNHEALYEVFAHNIRLIQHRVTVKRGYSDNVVPQLDGLFDFIYVDGDHRLVQVHKDLVMSWPKLKVGGIMLCDDYLYQPSGEQGPKCAIDVFVMEHRDELEVLPVTRKVNAQYAVRKVK